MTRTLHTERLVVATHNAGKLKEISGLIAPFGIIAQSAGELGLAEPDENGTTFEENARTKAQAAAEASRLPALSDDSGLCVDALNGAPGVFTADWAVQPDGSRDFGKAMQRVEDELQAAGAHEPAQRRAKFVAVLCLAWPDGHVRFFRGEVAGQLVWPPRGRKGFGFDPVFLPDGFDRTFGEMESGEKHAWEAGRGDMGLSHRARAFAAFAAACLGAPR